MNDSPINAIAAVQHANPYPYYALLRQGADLTFDTHLNLWLAAKAGVVLEVLAHPAAKVRPYNETVPAHLAGSTVGQVFSQLIRMTDGQTQQQAKIWLAPRLHGWSDALVRQQTLLVISALQQELATAYQRPAVALFDDIMLLNEFIQQLPVRVVAALLEFNPSQAKMAATAIADFIRTLAPSAAHDAAVMVAGEQASQLLLGQLQLLMPPVDLHWQRANLLGLLMQSYEATAGLIGNSLVALTEQQLWPTLRADPRLCLPLVAEVVRYDAPVQNTRRFIHADCEIAGIALPAGSTVLLLLAAAGRDESVYPQPEQFRLDRLQQTNLTFSSGAHQCPGQQLALQISAVAVEFLLSQTLPPLQWRYRPSLNGRLSWFFSDLDTQSSDPAGAKP
ncbi:cytochrome P450 [Rheinheimera sp. SA_1]|uniref:cytochrome P450 n=1 Tax=Rheinheimera sp. SA_1 TaxID=1827365 RepID=UPI0009EEAB40|nr:cytochrome P450 [Rheinheimera sp. SA_1]